MEISHALGSLSLNEQFQALLLTVGIGLVMGVCFDIYRVIRGLARPQGILNHVGDLIIWVAITVLVCILLLMGNWGEVRLYVFIGFVLGLVIYRKVAGNRVVALIRWLIAVATQLVRWAILLVLWPFRLLIRLLLIPLGLIGKIFELFWRMIKGILGFFHQRGLRCRERWLLLARFRRPPPPPPAP